MSALEPDAPAPHHWPHWRPAVRSWWAHRSGSEPSSPDHEPHGKPPSMSDVLRVGQVMRNLGLLHCGELTRAGKAVVEVALGLRPRSNQAVGAKSVEVLVAKLVRHLRRAGIIAVEEPRPALEVVEWTDPNDGQRARTKAIVDSA